MSVPRLAWLGFHAEGVPALEALLVAGAPIAAILTLRADLAAQRSGGADFRAIGKRHGVPVHEIANINDPEGLALLGELAPDVLLVIGWHQILRAPALRLLGTGAIGAHASLLPHNRGSAPVNWALIRGETEAGNSLLWLAEGVDAGDLIDQTRFPITPYDTCATLYARVALSNREMLLRVLPDLLAGAVARAPQPASDQPVLPRRRPADGDLDWAQPTASVYDFIRALTHPYPGAFSRMDGERWRVWQAALPPRAGSAGPPGTVLGPVVSPVDEACGQLVSCGEGAIVLLEVENDAGLVLRGRDLSDAQWTGLRWQRE